ncbi:hypothetical protein NA57DRAFT_77520 [Rhizodiscina lignyota]|uniref:Cytochrome oxidase c assembly-domain-containing protein n=1 Tax=Rhizodiscina lignyota TaxID=1504668 RepID=A0A9P4I8Q9_9PEZI|nr:hypothetical protein NA57DRAFT_77520 [Rhizodiscina lignyota]
MARSARDATLFTQTGPYASSKPTHLKLDSVAPPNETPAQKVARLRAAAQRARLGQESTWDKVVRHGRVVADKSHRITVYSLLIFSGLAGAFITFSMVDLILYNRRKKKEWAAVEKVQRAATLTAAIEAVEQGTASEAQAAIVQNEREKAAEAERKNNRKWSDFFYSGLSKEEKPGGTLAAAIVTQEQEQGVPMSVVKAVEEYEADKEAKRDQAARTVKGGHLDQIAENAAQAATEGTKGWMSWIRGR